MKKFICTKNSKLSDAVADYYGSKITYAVIMKLLRKKDIKINGVRVNSDCKIAEGDEIEVYYDGLTFGPEIVYQD
ncbi:MAG: hypothetical protein MJ072_04775, partial [Clostridia bacterium]|nr:hypothetical protein [Clostridia bacterium]